MTRHQHSIKARASDTIRSLDGQLSLMYILMSSADPHPIYNLARAKAIQDINQILDNYRPEEFTDAEYEYIMTASRYLLTAEEDIA
jgi:hypothetical protein